MESKIIGLDGQYVKWSPLTILVEEYLERPGLERIIKMCRLKPRHLTSNIKKIKIKVYREWIDEYGNSLHILKNKQLRIQLNDLSIPRDRLVITDIYEGLPIQKISAMSYRAFLLAGKEGKDYQDHYVVSFLGLDDYLRTFCWLDGEWYLVPSLFLGLIILGVISNIVNSNWFMELPYKHPVVYPCRKQKMWFTGWPNKDELKKSFSGDLPLEKLLKELGV